MSIIIGTLRGQSMPDTKLLIYYVAPSMFSFWWQSTWPLMERKNTCGRVSHVDKLICRQPHLISVRVHLSRPARCIHFGSSTLTCGILAWVRFPHVWQSYSGISTLSFNNQFSLHSKAGRNTQKIEYEYGMLSNFLSMESWTAIMSKFQNIICNFL